MDNETYLNTLRHKKRLERRVKKINRKIGMLALEWRTKKYKIARIDKSLHQAEERRMENTTNGGEKL